MAERKAVNKYYPPEWTPEKGSINKFRGSHPLRDRARKLKQGILIIRFEMPYNIWCDGCGNHIGMGVRYNAEKSKVGMYYTTPIYKFKMKCHLCDNHFEMQTDPQNLDYVILNGARRQERRWDVKENEQVAPEEREVTKKLATDAMFRLEHGVEDVEKKKAVAPSITHLEEFQERWKDDYLLNQILRQRFRTKKKELKISEEQDKALLSRSSLDIPLLPELPEDAKLAGLLKLTTVDTFETKQKKKREAIENRPLFRESTSLQHLPKSSNALGKDAVSETKAKIVRSVVQHKMQKLSKSLSKEALGIVVKKPERCSQENGANITGRTTNTQESSEVSSNSLGLDSSASTNETKTESPKPTGILLVSSEYMSTDSEDNDDP